MFVCCFGLACRCVVYSSCAVSVAVFLCLRLYACLWFVCLFVVGLFPRVCIVLLLQFFVFSLAFCLFKWFVFFCFV